jgi:Phytanoyl-CoA dioxygenase (PhyH)
MPCSSRKYVPSQHVASASPWISWLFSVAAIGDSSFAVLSSFSIFVVALIVQWYFESAIPDSVGEFLTYESLGPMPVELHSHPKIYQVNVSNYKTITMDELKATITSDMHMEYERDGVICIRGLLSPDLLQQLDGESDILVQEQISKNRNRSHYHRRGTQFHTVTHSALFLPTDATSRAATSNKASPNTVSTHNAFMEVALWSLVPSFAAALLQWNPTEKLESKTDVMSANETLRVIRDIFLAKDDDTYVCGWHVDDLGFWPATPDSSIGINAWIALDDMEMTEVTGGFAVAVQSHTAPWKDLAYFLTGVPTIKSFPKHGYQNASHMFQERTGYGTCNIQKVAPHIHRRLEETSRIYPVRRGDVIFHTRWLFHRTVPIIQAKPSLTTFPSIDGGLESPERIYRRYSIRYGLGSSTIIPPGFGTELSVLFNESNGGLSANSVCQMDGPWYPQAYPPMSRHGIEWYHHQFQTLLQDKLPIALRRQISRKQEMKKQMAKNEHRLATIG